MSEGIIVPGEKLGTEEEFAAGENTASIDKKSMPPAAELRASLADSPRLVTVTAQAGQAYLLQHFRAILGGNINGPYQYNVPGKPARKQFWFWSLGGPAVLRVCRLLEPWMGKRRRERMEQLGMFTQQQFEFADDYLEDEES